MVAGDEERTLSVSGAVPPGLAASRRSVLPERAPLPARCGTPVNARRV
jgi:hypothetical protein